MHTNEKVASRSFRSILISWRHYDQAIDTYNDTPRVQHDASLRPEKGKRESSQRWPGDERDSPNPGQHSLGPAAEGRVRDRSALGAKVRVGDRRQLRPWPDGLPGRRRFQAT